MNSTEVFKELGFTEGEIKVYYSLFDLGETTVGPISRKSGVTHAKVYPILQKLINKGLVSSVIKDGRKNFSAANPNSLLDFIDNKARFLEDEKIKLKELIPSLLAKQKEEEKIQYSRVFEGIRGLKSLFYELFENNKNKEICVFGLNELLGKIEFKNFFLFYHELRRKNKIKLRLILSKDVKKYVAQEYSFKTLYSKQDKIKFIDTNFPVGVFIIEDHVVNVVSEEKITAFDIKSQQNYQKYMNFFNSIWNSAH